MKDLTQLWGKTPRQFLLQGSHQVGGGVGVGVREGELCPSFSMIVMIVCSLMGEI